MLADTIVVVVTWSKLWSQRRAAKQLHISLSLSARLLVDGTYRAGTCDRGTYDMVSITFRDMVFYVCQLPRYRGLTSSTNSWHEICTVDF